MVKRRIVLYELVMRHRRSGTSYSAGLYRRYVGAQSDGAALAHSGYHYDIRRLSWA